MANTIRCFLIEQNRRSAPATKNIQLILLIFLFSSLFIQLRGLEAYGSDDIEYMVSDNYSIFATTVSGQVYKILDSGQIVWTQSLQNISARPVQVGKYLAVGTSGGKVILFNKDTGQATKQLQADGYVSGLAGGDGRLFIAAGSMVSMFDLNSMSMNWSLPQDQKISSLSYNGLLYVVKNGSVMVVFPQTAAVTASYSVPELRGVVLSQGNTFAYTNADEIYKLDRAKNVLVHLAKADNIMGIKADDQYVYVSSSSGKVSLFSIITGKAVASGEEAQGLEDLLLLDKGFIVFGNLGNVYAYDSIGQKQFTISLGEHVTDWLIYKGLLVYAQGNRIASTGFDNVCGIESPQPQEIVASGFLEVKGMAYSASDLSKVLVTVGNIQVQAVGLKNWRASLDLSTLPAGELDLACYVLSESGEGPQYSIMVTKGQQAQTRTMYPVYPAEVASGARANIQVFDEQQGAPLGNTTLTMDGKVYAFSGNISLPMDSTGYKTLVLSRSGYDDYQFQIRVYGMDTASLVLIGLAAVLIIAGAYLAFIKK